MLNKDISVFSDADFYDDNYVTFEEFERKERLKSYNEYIKNSFCHHCGNSGIRPGYLLQACSGLNKLALFSGLF
jgi:hypothetical protein